MGSDFGDRFARPALVAAVAVQAYFLMAGQASAVPAYAQQTGEPCATCHVGGFGPQLTLAGRKFKENGYTTRKAGLGFTPPISAMAVASYVNTQKDQAEPPAPHYSTNNNVTLDEASIFIAGGIGDHFGGFSQFTYDGVGRAFGWDNLDLRAVDHMTLGGSDVLVGLTVNNNPAIEDPWNTLPSWGFPYTDSDLAPGPASATLFDGGYEQAVLGTTAYAVWGNGLYTEAGFYFTPGHHFLSALGADEGAGPISGVAPYVRVAYEKDYGDSNWEIGAFGFFPSLSPDGDTSTGQTDSYRDIGFDASYQLQDSENSYYTINARYTHEDQDLNATHLLGGSTNASDTLNDFRLDASYYWHNLVGASVQLFTTTGSSDALLYGDNRTLAPDSDGVTFQLDFTPWGDGSSPFGDRFNVRVGLQYTMYGKFDGASTNFDGLGGNASDNNTLRLFLWTAL
ncbi:MAG TPA: hypothetical protein VGF97_05470 [Rhizomicrobium sp.]